MNFTSVNITDIESIGVIKEDSQFKSVYACSFTSRMPIFKINMEIPNLSDRFKDNSPRISHNQAMHAGPCVNQKLPSSLMQLRFDPKVLIFDLRKVFLQIGLN